MSGPSATGSSTTISTPLSQRMLPAQKQMYGPAVGLGLMNAMTGSPLQAHQALAGWRGGVLSDTAGAQSRLGGQLAQSGISADSPIAAASRRGIEETGLTNLAAARGAYEKQLEENKLKWFTPTMAALANWPPSESNTYQQSQQTGGK
jgi:hypothetical protein